MIDQKFLTRQKHSFLYWKRIAFNLLLLSMLFLFPCSWLFSQEQSFAGAQKVLKAIEKILSEQPRENNATLRKIEITEDELNSYIAYRIETEKEETMKELHLKLFGRNRIEGKVLINLRGQKIPIFFRQEMNLCFEGNLETEEGKARLNIKKLFLENQKVQPKILDFIINIVSQIENTEPSSINDWYELPYNIKDVKTFRGKAVFFY